MPPEPRGESVNQFLIPAPGGLEHEHPEVFNAVTCVNKLSVFVSRSRQIVIQQLIDKAEFRVVMMFRDRLEDTDRRLSQAPRLRAFRASA